jgi:hypothetical protein
MTNIFQELEDLRNKWLDHDLPSEAYDKLIGECKPGCQIEIHWTNDYEGIIDYGYIFTLDGMYADIGDCFIHIPEQDNSTGKDRGEPEWDYMIRLMDNPYCKQIICK